ncbi:hypothetical protein ACWT_1107 [Actinoplanes sp. SE50]|uniref:hypothetical protein n=1 Tax=unclassified Actinoplanes TaxID=2626549 RepID=UPI00023ECE03|nr:MULTISPECIES: hypothetical protein [unclassified Actinoplanes]AEV82123.1 hypothetical protein ACPL_1226 [Actinoplanes sp. SE50/110]ATO80522.1 hypothetical protein ACWT_1107 [Actinoplanes sp. SE50]SLL97928.1 hypothetical protein ACSP50_1144 [Actinoplanes sp. SE50/110]
MGDNEDTGRVGKQIGGTVAVAVLSALSWLAWMGWDHEYQTDPATGVTSGPYEAWQVIGCALTLLAVFAGAMAAGVRPVLVSVALPLAFTAAWTVTAAADDTTGLYAAGALLLLLGLGAATVVASAITAAIRHWRAAPH